MSFTEQCNEIFNLAIRDYHVKDNVDTPINNPYDRDSIENRLYLKCWIDTVQWHYEDIIRDPHIDPVAALQLKRRIDQSNQDRTDLVEQIDSYFRHTYSNVKPLPDATINTESPRPSAPMPATSIARNVRQSSTCCSSSRRISPQPSTNYWPTLLPDGNT